MICSTKDLDACVDWAEQNGRVSPTLDLAAMTDAIEVRGVLIPRKEIERLHLDWGGKCWTCDHWTGDMTGTDDVRAHAVLAEGKCTNPESEHHGEQTDTDGPYMCRDWRSWDPRRQGK